MSVSDYYRRDQENEPAIAAAPNANAADDIRLTMEFFCDPSFRSAVEDIVARANGVAT